MNPDFKLFPTKEEVCRPHLHSCLQEFNQTAEGMRENTFPPYIGVLNTIPDTQADGHYPRKRIRLALGGTESPEESASLVPVGSDAAEITETFTNFNFPAKGTEHMNGSSNDASCYVVNAKGLGSPNPINLCLEEQDYIGSINLVQDYLDKIKNIARSGDSQDVLKAAVDSMEHVINMLSSMRYLGYRRKKKKGPLYCCANRLGNDKNVPVLDRTKDVMAQMN